MSAALALELAPHVSDATETLAGIRAMVLTTPDDLTWAAEITRDVKARWAALDARRKEITGPIRQAEKSTNDLFRPVLDALVGIEEALKGKMGDYARAVESARLAAVQASAIEYQAGGTPTALIPEPASVAGVAIKFRWAYRVTNPAMVPRAFCSPDDALIRRHAAMADTPHTKPLHIDGVEFFPDSQVSVRK